MEAVFELVKRNPTDDRTFMAALGVAEKSGEYSKLLGVLSAEGVRYDFMSKSYLKALTEAMKHTHLPLWPIDHIESVLVTCLPRWGLMISRDSLSELFNLLHVIVKLGLSVLNTTPTGNGTSLPMRVYDDAHSIRTSLLRVIWYSSALSTLLTSLKSTAGDADDVVVNILLHHHKDNEDYGRSVVEAQERALMCLGDLFELVSSVQHDQALNQLGSVLKQAGSDLPDSSALPLFVSVSSFLIGNGETKVRPETVDAAANCLVGIVGQCDISPSFFHTNYKVKKLGERTITAAIQAVESRQSIACARLLDMIVVRMPSVCAASGKEVSEVLQTQQCLFRSSKVLSELSSVTLSSAAGITSGKAVVLTRLMSTEHDNARKALESSIGDPEWLETQTFPTKDHVATLSNYYSFLQSVGVHSDWVSKSTGSIAIDSLNYLAVALRGARAVIDLNEVNRVIEKSQSVLSLLETLGMLLRAFLGGPASAESKKDLIARLRIAITGIISKCDLDVVRECPLVVKRYVILLTMVQQETVASEGLKVTPSESNGDDSKNKIREIVSALIMNCLSFSHDAVHLRLSNEALKLIPFLVVNGGDHETSTSIISAIITSVAPHLVLSSTAAVLSALESLIQTTVGEMDETAKARLTEFILRVIDDFSRHSALTDKAAVVHLLSLAATILVVLGSSDSGPFRNLWTVIACHPMIQAAAASSSWDIKACMYTLDHLIWVHALQLGCVLLTQNVDGHNKFLQVHQDILKDRFGTAHTSDLATLEEACLISRLLELASAKTTIADPLLPFQYISLLTPKPPSLYPKSRIEKLAGGLPVGVLEDDVQQPCFLPSEFAQRVAWIAGDILSSSLRRISRASESASGLPATDQHTLFHALLDSCHFVIQYLAEVCSSRKNLLLKTCKLDDTSDTLYVALSVYLSVDGSLTTEAPKSPQKKPGDSKSLLNSLPSPALTANKPKASLMDSLEAKTDTKSTRVSGKSHARFLPPQLGDCPVRTGLSFIAPSLVTEDDYMGKLVEVLTLCLIHAMRLATTEGLIRPLLDLLLTTRSNHGSHLPNDAAWIISEVIEKITPRYNDLVARHREAAKTVSYPQLGNMSQLPASRNPLGFAAISNIR